VAAPVFFPTTIPRFKCDASYLPIAHSHRKTSEILHGCSNAQPVFTRVHFVDLRTRRPLRRGGLSNPSYKGATLLGVTEFLTLEDLELPVPLDDRDDGNRIAGECGW